MQGRLLPKYEGRYQAHPAGYWKEEFPIAKKLGLDCIEFILDLNDHHNNPLMSDEGLNEIASISEETDVKVLSVCADCFMDAPLHSSNQEISDQSLKILNKLINNSSFLGIKDIVIPCVDQSSLNDKDDRDRLIQVLKKLLNRIEKKDVNLSLETDLAPDIFLELLSAIDSRKVTVNYDIGNSASLGYDLKKELETYGYKISDIHIKDRIINGSSVELGLGDADFKSFFLHLKKYNYEGPFIMQAYRDDEGLEIFKKQFKSIKKFLL